MKKLKILRSDVIIDYIDNYNDILPSAVVYVRPETNEIHYEKAIIMGITPFADVIYLANINGKIFIKDALILEHYSSQYKFSITAKQEMAKHPEMVKMFEDYFKEDFVESNIIGSFDAILKINMTSEVLFNTVVSEQNFLKFYGQTIKKINNYYIVNYDIPAIIKRYTPKANVFAIAIKFKNENISFTDINQSIFDQIKNSNDTPLIYDDEYKNMNWIEKVKRTYHISKNNVMAMFDMVDFIITTKNVHIKFENTPLGRILTDKYNINSDDIFKIKDNPLVYAKINGIRKLINIIEEADGKNLIESADFINSIINDKEINVK